MLSRLEGSMGGLIGGVLGGGFGILRVRGGERGVFLGMCVVVVWCM